MWEICKQPEKIFIGFLHIPVASHTTLNNFIILSVILCLWSWGWARTAFAVLTSALGREFAVLFSPQEHQKCLSQLQGYRDLKLWLICWHQCVHASSHPACSKTALMTHFSNGHFYLAIPVILKEKAACKALELQKSPPLFPVLWWREDECLVGRRRGQLCCLICLGDPFRPLLLEGSWEAVAEWWRALLPDRLTSGVVTKKRGDFGKRHFWVACFSVGGKLGMLFWW